MSRWKGFGELGFFLPLPKGEKLHERQFSLDFLWLLTYTGYYALSLRQYYQ